MNFSDFLSKVNDGFTLIPLIKEIDKIDNDAIDIYAQHFDEKKSFFFESLEGDKNWSRYTIIGCSSGDYIEVTGHEIKKFNNYKLERKFTDNNPVKWLEDFFSSHKVFIAKNLPSFCGGFVGHFSFESVCFFEDSIIRKKQSNDINAPDISLIICKEFIVFDKVNNKIYIVVFSDNSESSYKTSQKKINHYQNLINKKIIKKENRKSSKNMIIKNDFEKDDFLKAVKDIKTYITSGDVMQVVLSQRMTINFEEEPIDFYRELRKINPSPYMYYLNMGDYIVVGSSPEILARLENSKVTVRPIAGTRPRGGTPTQDKEYELDLMNDKKELAEHLMLIDLGRNDIGRICDTGTINLTDRMIIEKYSHVMHIVSNVEGRIKPKLSMFDVLKATFPAGTVSGAPKIRALQIIFELESINRGIYAGAIGYFGWNGNMDTAIAIRTCIIKSNKLYIQCGAGIVHDSVPESEWDETINKGKAIIRALEKLREHK
tara:strand:+ start:14323 stop:15783 length:1461 start_codon:yes stop_codon:yes gene_type:complete